MSTPGGVNCVPQTVLPQKRRSRRGKTPSKVAEEAAVPASAATEAVQLKPKPAKSFYASKETAPARPFVKFTAEGTLVKERPGAPALPNDIVVAWSKKAQYKDGGLVRRTSKANQSDPTQQEDAAAPQQLARFPVRAKSAWEFYASELFEKAYKDVSDPKELIALRRALNDQVKPRTKKARWSIAGESGVKEQGLWEGLSAEQKEDYYRLADADKERYLQELAAYWADHPKEALEQQQEEAAVKESSKKKAPAKGKTKKAGAGSKRKAAEAVDDDDDEEEEEEQEVKPAKRKAAAAARKPAAGRQQRRQGRKAEPESEEESEDEDEEEEASEGEEGEVASEQEGSGGEGSDDDEGSQAESEEEEQNPAPAATKSSVGRKTAAKQRAARSKQGSKGGIEAAPEEEEEQQEAKQQHKGRGKRGAVEVEQVEPAAGSGRKKRAAARC